MEKYSRWRDQGTGIHPFLPSKPNSERSALWFLKNWIFGPILAILRFPFILIASLWFFLMALIAYLIPIAILRRFFVRYTEALGSRFLLFLMGFHWIQTKMVSLKNPKAESSQLGSLKVKAGDLIVCNHTSYVEILYLAFRFSPVFTAIPNVWQDEAPKGVAHRRTTLQALWDAAFDAEHSVDQSIPLKTLLQDAKAIGAPLVVFPEGTTSNGKSILSCLPILQDLPLSPDRIHVIGFRYDFDDFSPSHPVGNAFFHLFKLCSQLQNAMEVRSLNSQDVPAEGEAICNQLAPLLRLRKVALTAKDKLEFKNYWHGHLQSYKKTQ